MARRRSAAVFVVLTALSAAVACSTFGADDAPSPAAEDAEAGEVADASEAGVSDAPSVIEASPSCDPEAGVTSQAMASCTGDPTFMKDLASDPANCGRCGHDCLGGACAGGVCQPKTIFTNPTVDGGMPSFGAFVIGIAGGYVYWGYAADSVTSAHVIRRGLVDGGALEVVGQTAKPMLAAAVDESGVYYAHDDGIFRAAVGGPVGRLATMPGVFTQRPGIALSPDQIYVADDEMTVSSIPKMGGTPTLLSSSTPSPTWPVVDGVWTAWLAAPWEKGSVDAGAVLAGFRGVDSFSVQLGLATSLTKHAGSFYWLDVGTHTIGHLGEISGAAQETVASVGQTPARRGRGLVVDTSRAFVGVEPSDNAFTLIEASLCGGPTSMRVTNQSNMYSDIAGDETAIYWGLYSAGVLRLAK